MDKSEREQRKAALLKQALDYGRDQGEGGDWVKVWYLGLSADDQELLGEAIGELMDKATQAFDSLRDSFERLLPAMEQAVSVIGDSFRKIHHGFASAISSFDFETLAPSDIDPRQSAFDWFMYIAGSEGLAVTRLVIDDYGRVVASEGYWPDLTKWTDYDWRVNVEPPYNGEFYNNTIGYSSHLD